MDRNDAKAIIENILFVADAPLPAGKITPVFAGELSQEEVDSILGELTEDYQGRALMVAQVAEGWRIQTRPEYASWITAFFKMEKGQKLSRASLEVLAIVAYRQPITRTEMDEIRGVDCGGVLRGLIDKGLVKTMGRRRAPGKPMMYGTTNKFLEFFGLARLSDLPTLDEFRIELGDGDLAKNQPGLPFEGEEAQAAPQEEPAFGEGNHDDESSGEAGQELVEEPSREDEEANNGGEDALTEADEEPEAVKERNETAGE